MRIPVTADISLYLHDLGGDGPPLLLCHATGFHGRVWEPLARVLSDRWHCWAPDLRGHGDSPVPPGTEMHWERFADDVLAVVDELDRGAAAPLAAVGHSKGGAALLTAELHRPGTFRDLYLFEPIVFPGDLEDFGERAQRAAQPDNPMAVAAERRRPTFPSPEAAYENFASKPPLMSLHPDVLRAYVDHGFADAPDGRVTLKCRPDVEASVYRMGAHLDAWHQLERISCRVTIAASGDGGTPSLFAPMIAERIPGAQLERFEGLGHFGPLEDPSRVGEAIHAALTSPR